jgi:hypothetical protein
MLLAGPRDEFVVKSVQDSEGDWVRRFDTLLDARTRVNATRYLGNNLELPSWLREDYTVWERNNRWIVQTGVASGTAASVLIALWDGQAGDGPGGTSAMVDTVQKRGGRVILLDARKLL